MKTNKHEKVIEPFLKVIRLHSMSGSACPDRMQTETFLLLQLDWPVLYLSKTSSWSVPNPHPLPVRSLFEKQLLCNFKKTNKKNSVECKNVPTGIVSLFSKTFLTYLIWLAFQVTFHLRHWKHSLLALCSHMQAFTHVACLDSVWWTLFAQFGSAPSLLIVWFGL